MTASPVGQPTPQPQLSPVVLLRGLAREQRHWGEFRTLLQQHLANPVLALDLPGMGQLYHRSSPARIDEMARQLQALLSAVTTGPCHLFAMSLGAMVAASVAAQSPAQVASLLLINSSAGSLTPFYQRLKWRSYPKVLQALFASAARREQLILQLTVNQAARRRQQLELWQRYALEKPVRTADVLRQLLAASRFVLPARPACPVLLLASEADRLVDWRASRQIANRWQAPLLLHPSAGHDLALDAPQWLVEQAVEFYHRLGC